MAAITLVTGGYPTVAPSNAGMAGKTVERTSTKHRDADIKVVVTANTGAVVLIGWDGAHWCGIGGDISLDSTVRGGITSERFTPGSRFTHFALWEKTAGATVTSAAITLGDFR